jgi:hypothetical protein
MVRDLVPKNELVPWKGWIGGEGLSGDGQNRWETGKQSSLGLVLLGDKTPTSYPTHMQRSPESLPFD